MIRLLVFAILACSAALPQPNGVPTLKTNVKQHPYNARGDGASDDTANIQRALDAAHAAGGGTVYFPCGTYALASPTQPYRSQYWQYLRAESGVYLQGESKDCVTLQPTDYQGKTKITTLVFGSDRWSTQAYQETQFFNGRTWYPLQATMQGSKNVTLSNESQASKFHPGDYVYLALVTSQTTLANPMANKPFPSMDTVQFTSSRGFPETYPFYVWLGYNEELKVTGLVKGTTYSCIRGWAGSPQSAHSIGDHIQLFLTGSTVIAPGEPSQVASVDRSAGTLTLQYPMARSFPNPLIGNVTTATTHDVGVSDMTIKCQYCISLQNVFRFKAARIRAVVDSSSSSAINFFNSNSNRGISVEDSEFVASGARQSYTLDIAANNTQDILFANNTVTSSLFGSAEYPAHFMLRGNHISLSPGTSTYPALMFQGTDMVMSGNTITVQLSRPGAIAVTDYVASAVNAEWEGQQTKFIDNDITCMGSSGFCIKIRGMDTVLSGGTVNAGGAGIKGLLINDTGRTPATPQQVSVQNVRFDGLAGSYGIMVEQVSKGLDGFTFANNTLEGNADQGLYLPDLPNPNQGKGTITGNHFSSGIKNALHWTPSSHPGVITDITGAGGR